jgi:hypothetical protein
MQYTSNRCEERYFRRTYSIVKGVINLDGRQWEEGGEANVPSSSPNPPTHFPRLPVPLPSWLEFWINLEIESVERNFKRYLSLTYQLPHNVSNSIHPNERSGKGRADHRYHRTGPLLSRPLPRPLLPPRASLADAIRNCVWMNARKIRSSSRRVSHHPTTLPSTLPSLLPHSTSASFSFEQPTRRSPALV